MPKSGIQTSTKAIDDKVLREFYNKALDNKERSAERIKLTTLLMKLLNRFDSRVWNPELENSFIYGGGISKSDININIKNWTSPTPLSPTVEADLRAQLNDHKRAYENFGVKDGDITDKVNEWIRNQTSMGNKPDREEIIEKHREYTEKYKDLVENLNRARNVCGMTNINNPLDGFCKAHFRDRFLELNEDNHFTLVDVRLVNRGDKMIRMVVVGRNQNCPYTVEVSFEKEEQFARRISAFKKHYLFRFIIVVLKELLQRRGLYGSKFGYINGTTLASLVAAFLCDYDRDFNAECIKMVSDHEPVTAKPTDMTTPSIAGGEHQLFDALLSFLCWIESKCIDKSLYNRVIDFTRRSRDWTERTNEDKKDGPILRFESCVSSVNCARFCTKWLSVHAFFMDLKFVIGSGIDRKSIMREFYPERNTA